MGADGPTGLRPYRERVEAYDLVHARKPYATESRRIRALIRRYAGPQASSMLDVACGTGRHLEQFARWFDCTGLDSSPAMLAAARRRLPGVRLVRGDMRSFDLGRRFDAVVCLFSAIGYVRTEEALRRALQSFARHLTPHGLVVVEPWLTPQVYRTGRVDSLVARRPGLVVLRMNDSRRNGRRSVMDLHYLVGADGRVAHFEERHDLGLFDVPTMRRAFRSAGLRPIYLRPGDDWGRGLWIGRPSRPGGARPTRRRRPVRSLSGSARARTNRSRGPGWSRGTRSSRASRRRRTP